VFPPAAESSDAAVRLSGCRAAASVR